MRSTRRRPASEDPRFRRSKAKSLLCSAKEASGFFLVLRTIYTGPGIQRDLANAFGKGVGTAVGPVTVEQRPSIPAGDESVTLVARVTLAGTPLRVAFVNLRIDRVIGILIVAGRASMFHFSDVRPLVDTFAKRIKEGL